MIDLLFDIACGLVVYACLVVIVGAVLSHCRIPCLYEFEVLERA